MGIFDKLKHVETGPVMTATGSMGDKSEAFTVPFPPK